MRPGQLGRPSQAAVPNQRDKSKLYLGGFVEKELQATLSRMAREEGLADNRFGLITRLLKEAIRSRSRREQRRRSRGSKRRPPQPKREG